MTEDTPRDPPGCCEARVSDTPPPDTQSVHLSRTVGLPSQRVAGRHFVTANNHFWAFINKHVMAVMSAMGAHASRVRRTPVSFVDSSFGRPFNKLRTKHGICIFERDRIIRRDIAWFTGYPFRLTQSGSMNDEQTITYFGFYFTILHNKNIWLIIYLDNTESPYFQP